MDRKHIQGETPPTKTDAPLPKRQKRDASPQPLISDEQRFWTSVAEPLDIEYEHIIEWHEYTTGELLKDHAMPFRERCAKYEFADTVQLEHILLQTWSRWLGVGRGAPGSKRGREFVERLRSEVCRDLMDVTEESEGIRRSWKEVGYGRVSEEIDEREVAGDEMKGARAGDGKLQGETESGSEGYDTAEETVASPR